jgi:hypothetical protein
MGYTSPRNLVAGSFGGVMDNDVNGPAVVKGPYIAVDWDAEPARYPSHRSARGRATDQLHKLDEHILLANSFA